MLSTNPYREIFFGSPERPLSVVCSYLSTENLKQVMLVNKIFTKAVISSLTYRKPESIEVDRVILFLTNMMRSDPKSAGLIPHPLDSKSMFIDLHQKFSKIYLLLPPIPIIVPIIEVIFFFFQIHQKDH